MVDFNTSQINAAITSGTSPSDSAARVRRHDRFTVPRADRAPQRPAPSVRPTAPAQRRPSPAGTGKIRITFEVYEEFAPAFRSAVDELQSILGARSTGTHRFSKEQAITDALVSVAALRTATFAKIPAGDDNYV